MTDTLTALLHHLRPQSTDEEKWVGLYLIPKTLKPTDTLALNRVFDHLPWSFIRRLLIQKESKGETDKLYPIAILVLSCFCQSEELDVVDNEQWLQSVPLSLSYYNRYLF